jgi:phospholipid:diacylglycerol acyltransferase
MPRALMADKDCWLQLMALDPVTGVDPEGTRLRAHEGLDGVDFFVPVC